MNLTLIQNSLMAAGFDGWLFADFRHSNPLAYRVLGLPVGHRTRRWYVFVPARGEPSRIVSAVEPNGLEELPGRKIVFRSWQERESTLRKVLAGSARIAMEYSPANAIPYVATVDAGTIELVRSFGVEVVSSADLVQQQTSIWTADQVRMHHEAGAALIAAKNAGWDAIREAVSTGREITDVAVQQVMIGVYRQHKLVFEGDPIVAISADAANPHFAPDPANPKPIRRDDLVLIDFWAKVDHPDAVYADYTQMAYVGTSVPERVAALFSLVSVAREAAIGFVRHAIQAGRPIRGFEVDRIARSVIDSAGYGDYFVHRTGHNIGREVHGEGANMDDFETHDERLILPGTCFSIEPGIYIPDDLGFRSEVDVLVQNGEIAVSGERQMSLACLL